MSNVSLGKDLTSLNKQFSYEIDLIRKFVKLTDQSLSRRSRALPKKLFTEDQSKLLIELLDTADKGKRKRSAPITLPNELEAILVRHIEPLKHKGFLSEMSLTYLVTYFEAFVKDTVECILVHRPNMLMDVMNITFEQVQSVTSMKDLRRSIAQKEADKLGYGSIDDIHKYFDDKMNITLGRYQNWDELREIVYRRNIIVHNSSKTNDAYCKNTGYRTVGIRLATKPYYVIKATENIDSFFEYCHKCIRGKFKI